MLGRAKSCRWQVFVRRRPPKQGELRTDVSKATMFQGDRAAKDLIGFVRSFCLGVLIRGLESLESPFGKVLILFVRSRHCGVLIRGLQNLETPERETFLFFSLVRKEPKVPQRVATLWTPGDDSNLRSIRSFILNDRPSSCNRRYRKTQPSRVSPVRI